MTQVLGWHAHFYFDAATVDQARAICERAALELPVVMGRVHEKRVGPHGAWSCQLSFGADDLNEVLPWLLLNRQGLSVLLHPRTGDDLVDHRDLPVWLGEPVALDLSVLSDG